MELRTFGVLDFLTLGRWDFGTFGLLDFWIFGLMSWVIVSETRKPTCRTLTLKIALFSPLLLRLRHQRGLFALVGRNSVNL